MEVVAWEQLRDCLSTRAPGGVQPQQRGTSWPGLPLRAQMIER